MSDTHDSHLPAPAALEEILERACAGGSITTVEGLLWVMTILKWPGYQLGIAVDAASRFILRQEPQIRPLFNLHHSSGLLLVDKYLLALDAERGEGLCPGLRWLTRLACHTNAQAREKRNDLMDFLAGDTENAPLLDLIQRDLTGDVCLEVAPSDRPTIEAALDYAREFASTPPPLFTALCAEQELSTAHVDVSAAIYPFKDALSLARPLMTAATPFAGPGGKILIIHCNDQEATPHLVTASEVVSRESNEHIIDRLCCKAFSRRGLNKIIRQNNVWRWARLGVGNRQIARYLLENGLSTPTTSAEDGSYRVVRNDLAELRNAGVLPTKGRMD
jgi:hypothetical protein